MAEVLNGSESVNICIMDGVGFYETRSVVEGVVTAVCGGGGGRRIQREAGEVMGGGGRKCQGEIVK